MAKRASKETVAADLAPPNFRGAVQLIRGAIVTKKSKIQGINAEIGDQWAKVESYKVNKKAGQIFATLDKLEHADRMDIMRSLNGLMDASGWEEEDADIVDRAEGNVVSLRFGGKADDAEEHEGDGATNAAGEDTEIAALCDQIAPPKPIDGLTDEIVAKGEAKKAALDAAAKRPANEPYTGDNADLANDGDADETPLAAE